jgi:hypothetical protein
MVRLVALFLSVELIEPRSPDAADDRFFPADAELAAARFAVLRLPPSLPALRASSG